MPLLADVREMIANAAARFGVSTRYLETTALLESSGNPNASTGSALGLFQFMPGTAAEYGLANPFDPQQASYAAAQLTATNFQFLQRNLGRVPSEQELYLAHQQGASGALALLTRGNEPATSVVGKSAVLGNAGNADMTASDFVSFITGKYNAAAGFDTGDVAKEMATPTGDAAAIVNDWGHFFTRVVVVILGFIFTAVGLAMLRGRQETGTPVNVTVDVKGLQQPNPPAPKVETTEAPDVKPVAASRVFDGPKNEGGKSEQTSLIEEMRNALGSIASSDDVATQAATKEPTPAKGKEQPTEKTAGKMAEAEKAISKANPNPAIARHLMAQVSGQQQPAKEDVDVVAGFKDLSMKIDPAKGPKDLTKQLLRNLKSGIKSLQGEQDD